MLPWNIFSVEQKHNHQFLREQKAEVSLLPQTELVQVDRAGLEEEPLTPSWIRV